MSKLSKEITGVVVVVVLLLVPVLAFWHFQKSPRDAYKQGYIDGRSASSDTLWNRWLDDSLGWGFSPHVKGTPHFYSTEFHSMPVWVWPWNPSVKFDSTDTMKPHMTMELMLPSEIVRQIVDSDTLYFRRERVDTGYVLKPMYPALKAWKPYRPDWRDDWDDTSRGWGSIDSNENGWYGWEISEALAQSWYDRAADTSHSVYEKAAYAWAMSYLLRERKFVIYFDSTDTMPVMEMEGVEVKHDKH